jgi:hypothetical protein
LTCCSDNVLQLYHLHLESKLNQSYLWYPMMQSCWLLADIGIIVYRCITLEKSKKNRQNNGQKDKQRSTKHIHKTKDRITWTSLKTGGKLRCSNTTNLFSSRETTPLIALLFHCRRSGFIRGGLLLG